jgi:hypothetical protein
MYARKSGEHLKETIVRQYKHGRTIIHYMYIGPMDVESSY